MCDFPKWQIVLEWFELFDFLLCGVVFFFSLIAAFTTKDIGFKPGSWLLEDLNFYLIKYEYNAVQYNGTSHDPVVAYADLHGMYIAGLSGVVGELRKIVTNNDHTSWMKVISSKVFHGSSEADSMDGNLNECANKMILVGVAIWSILIKGSGARFVEKLLYGHQEHQEHQEHHDMYTDDFSYCKQFFKYCLKFMKVVFPVWLICLFLYLDINSLIQLDKTCGDVHNVTFSLTHTQGEVRYSGGALDNRGILYWLLVLASFLDARFALKIICSLLYSFYIYIYNSFYIYIYIKLNGISMKRTKGKNRKEFVQL